jgi:hypothetical protein
MESIINKFEEVLSLKKQGNCVESLINSLNKKLKLNTIDPTDEWLRVQQNYSKLIHLSQILNESRELLDDKFLRLFSLFLDKLDNINKYYLSEISFDTSNKECYVYKVDINVINDAIVKVQYNLEASLNTNDDFSKLYYITQAYEFIIFIVENSSNTRNTIYIDTEFVEIFKPYKKRKLNLS